MPYWIHRDGENVGPYGLGELRQLLESGHLVPEDLAIEEGAGEWTTVGEATASGGPALPEAPADIPVAELAEPAAFDDPQPELAEAAPLADAKPKSKLPLVLGVIVGVTALGAGGYLIWENFINTPDNSPVDKSKSAQFTKKTEFEEPPMDFGENNDTNDDKDPKSDTNGGGPVEQVPPPFPPIGIGNNTETETNATIIEPPILPPIPPPGNATEPVFPPPIQPVDGNKTVHEANASVATNAPVGAGFLPDDLAVAMQISPKRILTKLGGLNGVLTQVMGPGAIDQLPAPAKIVLNMPNPENVGIAGDQSVYLFFNQPADNPPLAGLILPLTDAKKFSDFLVLVATAAKIPGVEAKDLGGIQGLPLAGMPVVAGWNDQAAVLVGVAVQEVDPAIPFEDEDGEECDAALPEDPFQAMLMAELKSILAKKKPLIQARPQFAKAVQQPVDLGLWVNLTQALQLAQATAPELKDADLAKLGQVDLAIGVDFGQGEVTVNSRVFYDEKLFPDWSTGKPLDKALLDAMPGDALFTYTGSANPEIVFKAIEAVLPPDTMAMIDQQLLSLGLTWEKLKALPGGDFALSSPMDKSKGMPDLLLATTINDDVTFTALMNRLGEAGLLAEIEEEGYEMFHKEKVLYYSPRDLRPLLELGIQPDPPVPPLPAQLRKLHAESDFAAHINPAAVKAIYSSLPPGAGLGLTEKMLIEQIGNLDGLTFAVHSGEGETRGQLTVSLKDKSENVLKTLLRLATSPNAGGFPGGGEAPDGGGFPGPNPPPIEPQPLPEPPPGQPQPR